MMDRMWTFWYVARLRPISLASATYRYLHEKTSRQALDPKTRYTDLYAGSYGHVTWTNDPPSPAAKLSDIIDMGYAGPSIKIGEVMDTTSGPFCYLYL